MNCTDIRPLISAYFDGDATPDEYALVDRHLATCDDCRRVLQEYRAIGGSIRALPVPVPPSGLRRDVWRAIDALPAGSAGAAPRRGRITEMRPRPATAVEDAGERVGWGWGRLLPAASLVAAMLLVFVIASMVINNPTAAAARLLDSPPYANYGQALRVQFNKPVVTQDAVNNVQVRKVEGQQSVEVTSVSKSYDPTGRVLTIAPKDGWEPGAKYEIYVDAPRIGLGVAGETLDRRPISLAFSTLQYTATATNTSTSTPTATATTPATLTPEPTAVAQETRVPDQTPVSGVLTPIAAQDTPRPTATGEPPTATPEPSLTPEPTETATHQPSVTPAPQTTPTGTPGRKTPTVSATPRSSATPRTSPTPTPPCSVMPVNGFGKLWLENESVRRSLGCPGAPEMAVTPAAEQRFQGGYMFWRGDTKQIYVFLSAGYGFWYLYPDTWEDGDPTPVAGETPPPGLYAPVRGFGTVYYAHPGLQQALGWALERETSTGAAWQNFAGGSALWTAGRTIRVLFDDGTYSTFPDTYVTPTPGSTPIGPLRPPGN